MEPATASDIEALSAQLWDDAQRWADANMTWLSEQIGSITWPDETRYDQIRERLDAVADGLTVFLNEDFGELRNNLGFWRGDAAENFSDKFYNKFVDVVENQGWLIRKLVAAAAVFKGTIRYSQHALMNAVTYTRELLREQLRLRRDTRRGTELFRVFLTVAAGVTSVLSVYFSGGLSAAFTLAVIGQAFAGAAAMLPDNAPPREIMGATAEQLWTELFESVREIGQFVGKEYDYLFDDLREVEQREDKLQPGLTLVRPPLLDGPSGRTLHHITSPYFRGTDA